MPAPETNQGKARIVALDFTKGVLVLFMILYHWLNYFVSPVGWFYDYLRFITPSFVFISGFLITNVLLVKYGTDDQRLRWRLLERGLKLLALFTLLNLISGCLPASGGPGEVGGVRDVGAFVQNAKAVYLTGNGKVAAFQILVPISYVLMLASLLAIARPRFKSLAFASAAICGLLILGFHMAGQGSIMLECLESGILGLCIGVVPLRSIERLLGFPVYLLAAYGIYLLLVTNWEVGFALQIAGSLLTLLVLFWLGKLANSNTTTYRMVVTLGKYSLFAYIAQIVLLHLIRIGMRRIAPEHGFLIASFVISFASCILAVYAIDFVRSKAPMADRLYRYVFA